MKLATAVTSLGFCVLVVVVQATPIERMSMSSDIVPKKVFFMRYMLSILLRS